MCLAQFVLLSSIRPAIFTAQHPWAAARTLAGYSSWFRQADGSFTEKVVHNFENNGTDGYTPLGGVILDSYFTAIFTGRRSTVALEAARSTPAEPYMSLRRSQTAFGRKRSSTTSPMAQTTFMLLFTRSVTYCWELRWADHQGQGLLLPRRGTHQARLARSRAIQRQL